MDRKRKKINISISLVFGILGAFAFGILDFTPDNSRLNINPDLFRGFASVIIYLSVMYYINRKEFLYDEITSRFVMRNISIYLLSFLAIFAYFNFM